MCGPTWGANGGSVEKRLDCGYVLNVELAGILDRLDLGVREREASRLTQVFGPSNWKNRIAV